MEERRSFERFEIEGQALFEGIEAALNNVSFKGFSVYASAKKGIDEVVSFELVIPFLSTSIKGKGRVRGNREVNAGFFVIGIEFLDIDKDTLVYVINRLQTKLIEQMRKEKNIRPLDFFPY